MSLCEEELYLTWIIENFSYCDKRDRKEFRGPIFMTTDDTYFMGLIPSVSASEADSYFCISLTRYNLQKKKKVQMELCKADNEVIMALDEKNARITKQDEFDNYCFPFMKIDELEKIMKKYPSDTIVVRCKISYLNSSPGKEIKKIHSVAKTTILCNKYSCNLNVSFDKSSRAFSKVVATEIDAAYLKIIVKAPEDDVIIEIMEHEDKHQDYKVKCQVSLLDCDKTEILSHCDFFTFDHKSHGEKTWRFPTFLKKSFLKDRKLHNCCTLKFDFFISSFMSVHEFIEESDDPYHCFSLKTSENPVIDSTRDDINPEIWGHKYADDNLIGFLMLHRLILTSMSPEFSTIFDDMVDYQMGDINISTIKADTMLFLKYYHKAMTGGLDCEKMLELMLAAEKYQLHSLTEKCSEFLALHLDTYNICDVISAADKVGHKTLKRTAIKFIIEHCAQILGSPKWSEWLWENVKLGSEVLCELSKNIGTAK